MFSCECDKINIEGNINMYNNVGCAIRRSVTQEIKCLCYNVCVHVCVFVCLCMSTCVCLCSCIYLCVLEKNEGIMTAVFIKRVILYIYYLYWSYHIHF